MGFHKVETFPFQKMPRNLLANKTQVTPLRAPGLILHIQRVCASARTNIPGPMFHKKEYSNIYEKNKDILYAKDILQVVFIFG